MRMILLSLVLFGVAACQYTPAPAGAPAASLAARAVDDPHETLPRGDVYFQTALGRYDLAD